MSFQIAEKFIKTVEAIYERPDDRIDNRAPADRPNRMSEVGWVRDCKRRMEFARLYPEKKVISKAGRKRMAEGVAQEIVMRQELRKAGIKILDNVDKVVRIPTLNLTGHLDDVVEFDGVAFPSDYKTASGHSFKQIASCVNGTDMRRLDAPWLRHDVDQLMCYAKVMGAEFGLLYFKNKESGDKAAVVVYSDEDEFREIEAGVVEVNEAVKNGAVHPIIEDVKTCDFCDFKEFCFAAEARQAPGSPVSIMADEDLYALLVRRQQLLGLNADKLAKEWKGVQDDLKDAFAIIGAGEFDMGGFKIKAKPRKSVYYDTGKLDPIIRESIKTDAPWLDIKVEYVEGL